MAFHNIQAPLEKALEEFRVRCPDGSQTLDRLRAFGVKDTNHGVSEHDLHGALCVLLSDHVSIAIARIAMERVIQESNARSMVQRVLTPLASVLGHEAVVSRGGISIKGEYYIARAEHDDTRTGFDRMRRMIEDSRVPVLDRALEIVYARKPHGIHRVSEKQSIYIMALLLPEGPEKDARFMALSTSEGGRNHAKFLFESVRLAHVLAQEQNIVLQNGELTMGMPQRGDALVSGFAEAFGAPKKPIVSRKKSATGDPLRDTLRALIDDESITPLDAQIFYNLNGGDVVLSTDEMKKKLMERYKITKREIEEIEEDVHRVMKERDVFITDPEPSNVPHPSRAARL